jgi:hypothetical protein
MKIIWLLLLMPVHADEKVTLFPGTFETREACMQLGTVLITQREFRCQASPQKTAFAALEVPAEDGGAPILLAAR